MSVSWGGKECNIDRGKGEKIRVFRIKDIGCSEVLEPEEDIAFSRNIGQ